MIGPEIVPTKLKQSGDNYNINTTASLILMGHLLSIQLSRRSQRMEIWLYYKIVYNTALSR